MKIRNALTGLGLLVASSLSGCDMPKGRTWAGSLPSVPDYVVSVTQSRQGERVIQNELRIVTTKDKESRHIGASIYAADRNGNGRFTDNVDGIYFSEITSDTDPILNYAHPAKLSAILQEALPQAINNPAYK